LIEFSRQIFEN